MSINHLFSMGGYGVYVWTTYSITLIVFGINLLTTLREKREVKKILKNLHTETV